ncbi:MAG: hypothetical protein ACE5O2_03105 [Armatimonadota bacterium]
MSDRRRTINDLLALLVIAALSVGVLWRTTIGGKVMLPADLLLVMEPWRHYSHEFPEFRRVSNPILDAVQQFYPWRKFAGESLRRGELPLWNPYELCGNPFVGNNQSAILYPETWLHALMPSEHALGWATALYFFITGALTYWFLRVLRLRRPAALLGAVAFMFNGFIVGWLCFPSFRSVPGWLPGMLAAFELSLRTGRGRWSALCGLFVGMQFLAGNLHISLFVLMVFCAYVVFRCIGEWRRGGLRVPLLAAIGALCAVGLGALLAAPQLLPTLELAGMSSRAGGRSYAEHLKHAIPAPYLLAALTPDIFGNPVDYNHWGANLGPVYRAYTETTWYVGVAPVLLAPLAFLRRPRTAACFWLAAFAVGLGLAMGTPLYALVYHLVPGAKALPGIGRAILISAFSLAVLGATGMDALLERAESGRGSDARKAAVASGAAFAFVGLIGGLWVWMTTGGIEDALPGIGRYTLGQIGRFLLLCVLSTATLAAVPYRRRAAILLLLGILAADLYCFVDKFTPAARPEYLHVRARSIEIVRADREWPRILALGGDAIHRMAPNTPMIFGREDIQGSDSLEFAASRRLINALLSDSLGYPQPDPSLPAVDLLGAKYVISGVELAGVRGLELVSRYDSWLYVNQEAVPRAFCVPDYDVARDYPTALAQVSSPDFDPSARAVFVSGDGPTRQRSARRPMTPARVTSHRPNAVTVEGDFRVGVLLVLADTWYPGWRAFQDGRECRLMRADYSLRAVEIERPCRRVRFVYLPASFRVGAFGWLTAISLLAGVAAFCAGQRRRLSEKES